MAEVARFEDRVGAHRRRGIRSGVAAPPAVTVTLSHSIEEVEANWRLLAAEGIESPGQSYDFIRLWIQAHKLPARDQLFVVAALNGLPMALLPLRRQRQWGGSVFTWFPGTHVGCGAPLIDRKRFEAMAPGERCAFWHAVGRGIGGADLVYLPAVPREAYELENPFAGLGKAVPGETLYRAMFPSFAEADATQRSKSRRKHDRQQGEKLAAMGEVSFETVRPGVATRPIVDEMFRQRAKRFAVMGVRDPFAAPEIARFYRETVAPGSEVEARLHLMRLDGRIIAVRYSIAAGDRLFCLVSAMTDDPAVQPGSPGKQCLLRMMQTLFDEGFRVLDLGAGPSDEKRHWCNVQIPLDSRYLALTAKGRLMLAAHGVWQRTRRRIKSDKRLYPLALRLRAWLSRLAGGAPQTAVED
jgi:CelD/BcsL family acetyltransferase involved in cellulose biosynthesis